MEVTLLHINPPVLTLPQFDRPFKRFVYPSNHATHAPATDAFNAQQNIILGNWFFKSPESKGQFQVISFVQKTNMKPVW